MSWHSATANRVRLVLHTAAFWLMHGVRDRTVSARSLDRRGNMHHVVHYCG
jgi:hypothetical protein